MSDEQEPTSEPEQQNEVRGHALAGYILAFTRKNSEEHIHEVLETLDDLIPKKLKLNFAFNIDLTGQPTVEGSMFWANTTKYRGKGVLDDVDQGTFQFVDHDDGSAAVQAFRDTLNEAGANVTISSGDASVTLSGRKRRTKKPVVEGAAKEPEAQPGQEATHYPPLE